MPVHLGGPYPYVVTLQVTLKGETNSTEFKVPVIAYTVVEALMMAGVKAQGQLGVPIDAVQRATDIEPDYNYVPKPTPGAHAMQSMLDTVVGALLNQGMKEQKHGKSAGRADADAVKRDPGHSSGDDRWLK